MPRKKTEPTASTGSPFPLGATVLPDGSINFAVSSQYADMVNLSFFGDADKPWLETHQCEVSGHYGDVHFVRVSHLPSHTRYGYRVSGPWEPEKGHHFNEAKLLLDPYAKHIDRPSRYFASMKSLAGDKTINRSDSGFHAPKAVIPGPDHYDWEGDAPPRIPMTESVICELHVKGFSMLNPDVPEEIRGSYLGLAHPSSIDYLKKLGVTTVQLLPVHHHLDDSFLLEKGLVNYWGYNTIGFFAPEARYAATDDPVTEFRDMVKALHRAGIEVVLDVVYNHTGEAGLDGPTCFLRGYDNLCYYHSVPSKPGIYWDSTGCGNSVDVSHPRSLRLVMDSLRYWVEEMHVDGFRFDLAAELGRAPKDYNRRAPFFQAISQDPILRPVKMIAEPWDLGPDGYQIGNFPTNWAELNGKFRDGVRRFWHGASNSMGEFAARITGSEDLFRHNRRTPGASVNFITSHDGFTLNDLVSYNEKHNLANGENNRDGDSHNISFNHGVEGPTSDPAIRELRLRQVRNFLTTLLFSQGVPFLLAG
ncbi:MAG: glycogen debranching protein GlgX, partial [Verrucomicrobiota bacterium]